MYKQMYKQTSPLTCIKNHVGAHLQNQNEFRNRVFRNKTMKIAADTLQVFGC